jgi:hypothetical protein
MKTELLQIKKKHDYTMYDPLSPAFRPSQKTN